MGTIIVKFITRCQFVCEGVVRGFIRRNKSGMGYNITKLRNELTEKGYADDGLVAWGNAGSGALFGAVGAALASMHVISKKGNAILVIPFSNKEIFYSKGLKFEKQKISSVSFKGLLTKKLTIKTIDGQVFKYSITQGAGAVKTILNSLAL